MQNAVARCESVITGYYPRTVPERVHFASRKADNFKDAGKMPALPTTFRNSVCAFHFIDFSFR